MTYRETAKKLGLRIHLWRWGFQLYGYVPGGGRKLRPKIIPLDGWSFDPHEIVEAMANDPAFSISYQEPKPPHPSDKQRKGEE